MGHTTSRLDVDNVIDVAAPHSKHRHGLPICVVTTMNGYWLCLRLANYWRNSHHNRVGVVHVNSRSPPCINFWTKMVVAIFNLWIRDLCGSIKRSWIDRDLRTLDISNLFSLWSPNAPGHDAISDVSRHHGDVKGIVASRQLVAWCCGLVQTGYVNSTVRKLAMLPP
jgi:hypothetical protein